MIEFDGGLFLQHVIQKTFQRCCEASSHQQARKYVSFGTFSDHEEDNDLNFSSFSLIYLDQLVPTSSSSLNTQQQGTKIKTSNSPQQLKTKLEKAVKHFVDVLTRVLCSREWKVEPPQFVNILSSRLLFVKDRQQFSLVHLACDTNQVQLLEWIQMYSSETSVNCSTVVNTHVERIDVKDSTLWSLKDSNGLEPLFYAVNSSSKDCVAFLCSKSSVREEQLNLRRDGFGNLPIIASFKKGDYDMCDLLQLFGAKIDLCGGLAFGMGLQETLMHYAMRKRDIKAVRYLACHSSKAILKKNHRDETPLFQCLNDKRGMYTSSEEEVTTTNFGGKGGCDGCAVTIPNHVFFLSTILDEGKTLFGEEQFHKALLSKNSFGRNLLMESIVMNDFEVTRMICSFLLSHYGLSASSYLFIPAGGGDTSNITFLNQLIDDRDFEDSTIFHIASRYIGSYLSITNSTVRDIFKLLKELFVVTQKSNQSLKDFLKNNPSKYYRLSSGSKSLSKSIKFWIKLE
ncbi:hypothetical protein FDP41_008095 [Naegleria fowleri]|uniref:Uncharacterized protein n=1 Tax=Naegleria fowleri TaxID=5763 RepID=A0A6A5BFY0_NAEFO|nr:uncharacterized protein FDP41_008095 [Naegleria fowleri]KAF0973391.1 hypothetical protein FDP41_008095 [Naegleria fowleri]CAG4710846.1 unnamed protein product [Naegleria fowleri]